MLHPVTGAPVILQLSKQRGDDGQHKVLVCEAEGSPKPSVSWSINGTLVRTQTLHDLTERSRFSGLDTIIFLSQTRHICENIVRKALHTVTWKETKTVHKLNYVRVACKIDSVFWWFDHLFILSVSHWEQLHFLNLEKAKPRANQSYERFIPHVKGMT